MIHSVKKSCAILCLFIFLITKSYAQKWDQVNIPISQPSAAINLKLSYRHHATIGGQIFTCYIKNLTPDRITISFDMIASTVCGTEVSKHIDMELMKGEGDGNGSVMSDDYAGFVHSKDCEGKKFTYYSPDVSANVEGINRIKGMGYRNFSVKSFPEKTTASTAKNTSAAANLNSSSTGQNNNSQSQQQAFEQNNQLSENTTAYIPKQTTIENTTSNEIINLGKKFFEGMNKKIFADEDKTLARGKILSDFRKRASSLKLELQMNQYSNNKLSQDSFMIKAMEQITYASTYAYNDFQLYSISDELYKQLVKDNKKDVKEGYKNNDLIKSSKINLYFPKEKEFATDFIYFNLSDELPDLFTLPTCHCFTDNNYNRKIDSAFYFLRDSRKCNKISFGGKNYTIKVKTQLPDVINEGKAVDLLVDAVNDISFQNSVNALDLVDYYNAFVWIGYIKTKNAKTKNDLLQTIQLLEKCKKGFSFFPVFDKYYFNAASSIIKYFIDINYYRLYLSDDINAESKKQIPRKMQLAN